MNAFAGLLKKDLALVKFLFIVWMAVHVLGMIASWVIAETLGDVTSLVPFTAMFISTQFIFMPILMITLLRLEGKTQLWLYNPQSSWKLALSKLCSISIMQLCSQVLVALYTVLATAHMQSSGFISKNALPLFQGMVLHAGLFATAFYLSVIVFFLWTLYHSMGAYPAIRRYRILLIGLLIILYNSFETFLKYRVDKGNLSASLDISPKMHYMQGHGWEITYTALNIPIIPLLYYVLFTAVIFFLAGWMLDKKVEV